MTFTSSVPIFPDMVTNYKLNARSFMHDINLRQIQDVKMIYNKKLIYTRDTLVLLKSYKSYHSV